MNTQSKQPKKISKKLLKILNDAKSRIALEEGQIDINKIKADLASVEFGETLVYRLDQLEPIEVELHHIEENDYYTNAGRYNSDE